MEAYFDGQDYTIVLDSAKGEMARVREETLEARLKDQMRTKDLGKNVYLRQRQNDGMDGISVRYVPENSENWEAILDIYVDINERALSLIRDHGQFGTRYNGSDKIELFDGDPAFR